MVLQESPRWRAQQLRLLPNLRNNIIFNTSVQNGAGLTVAYRRSLGTAGALANYASTSNNNLFYAGTPSVTNLIYSDGTSSAQTIGAYKSGVFTAGTIAPRDGASISEDPEFQSTTGSSANFLKYKTTSAKQLESGAVNILRLRMISWGPFDRVMAAMPEQAQPLISAHGNWKASLPILQARLFLIPSLGIPHAQPTERFHPSLLPMPAELIYWPVQDHVCIIRKMGHKYF